MKPISPVDETAENQWTKLLTPKPNHDRRLNQSTKTSCKKTPRKLTDVSGDSEKMTSRSSDDITEQLSLYGFNAADWLDDSFADENTCADTIKTSPHPVVFKDNSQSTRSCFKIYEDCAGRSHQQNAVSQSFKNSNAKVLCDRTNVAINGFQILTKTSSPVTKRTLEELNLCKENHKTSTCRPPNTTGVYLSNRACVVDCKNSAVKNLSKRSSQVFGKDNHSIIVLSSAAVSRSTTPELSSIVTTSCQISTTVSSSLAALTSASAMFHSCIPSAVSCYMLTSNHVSYASAVSCSITVCSTVQLSESTKYQSRGTIQSSYSFSSTIPQLCPSSVKTPHNQYSVRSSCSTKFSTPTISLTPCNLPVQRSTMKPTPPMCSCGCRAKRKFVQSPGQNIGRPFYCCGSTARSSRKGCNFFKWENNVPVTPVAPTGVTPLSTKQFSSVQTPGGNSNFTTPYHARQATNCHVLVPPSFK